MSSTSSVEDETIQIFVKDVSGHNTIPLTIPASTTIQTLTSILALRTNTPPSSLRLVHAGRHLSSPTHTLSTISSAASTTTSSSSSSYNLPPNSTLHLALPLRGGMPPKKIRCSFKECKDAAQRIVGDCGFCNGHFCGRHRLLEDHKCEGLEDCKKESHERNADKLNSERTVAIKGV